MRRRSNRCDSRESVGAISLSWCVSCLLFCCTLPGCAAPNAQTTQSKAAASAKPSRFVDWYPSSIALPAGMQYPCALTALPKSLDGVPDNEREYVNHVYAMILQCVQAKVRMLQDLGSPQTARTGYSKYYYQIQPALEKIKKEKTPAGLERFRDDVVSAITLQCSFFDKGAKMIEARKSWNEVMAQPEGRQASGLLIDAFNQMQARYPQWGSGTKDSIYHHLCALDLF